MLPQMKSEKKSPSKSEAGLQYDKGWSRGKSTGRRQGIEECHKAAMKAGLDVSKLPAIPLEGVRGSQTVEQVQKAVEKLEAKLAKARARKAELSKFGKQS